MCARFITMIGFPVAVLGLVFFTGCSPKPKSYAPQVDPEAAGKAALEQYDANHDGKISGAELDKATSIKSNLEKIDIDHDGAVTAQEIAERIRFWQTDKNYGSRTPLRCTVFHNQQPLAGALVKLVPEKFLGAGLETVQGKTGEDGKVILSIPPKDPQDVAGVGPGFYRVEITKPGENIPAQYNTQTVLGLDTTMDNPALYMGAKFDLKY
jgi:hypothetical protein